MAGLSSHSGALAAAAHTYRGISPRGSGGHTGARQSLDAIGLHPFEYRLNPGEMYGVSASHHLPDFLDKLLKVPEGLWRD